MPRSIYSQSEDSGTSGRHPPRVWRGGRPAVHRHRRSAAAHQLDEGREAGEKFIFFAIFNRLLILIKIIGVVGPTLMLLILILKLPIYHWKSEVR